MDQFWVKSCGLVLTFAFMPAFSGIFWHVIGHFFGNCRQIAREFGIGIRYPP